MSDKTVKVTLVAVAQPYTQGIKQAQGETSKLGREIDQTGDKAKGFGTKVNAAKTALVGMAAAGAAVAGTALVRFLSDAVQAAGDLQQSVGGVESVFGDSAAQIHEFGKTSAESVGLSRNSFNELITVTGALLKNKGLEDFTERSLQLVQVGADLSATFGGTAKEAVEALNAAMRGESDPIERYGISLNQAAVNAELAAKGLTGLEGAALEQATAQARLDIIMRQSADSMGQFARESDTLQGQQQRLAAEWEDAKAVLGEALLPALTNAVAMMREGVEVGLAIAAAFEKIPTPVLTAAAGLAAVHVAGGPLRALGGHIATSMSAAGEAIGYARQAAERAGGGFTGAVAGMKTFTGQASLTQGAMSGLSKAGSGVMAMFGGPWGLAITGAATVLGAYISQERKAKAETEALTATLDEQTGAVTDNTREWLNKQLQEGGYLDQYAEWGGNVRDLTAAIEGDTEARKRVEEVTRAAAEADGSWKLAMDQNAFGLTNQRTEAESLMGVLDSYGIKIDEGAEKTRQLAEANDGLTDGMRASGDRYAAQAEAMGLVSTEATDLEGNLSELEAQEQELAEAAQEVRDAHYELVESLVAAVDAAHGAIDADIAYEEALDDLTASVKENGAEHDITTEKGRANMEALLDVAGAARDSARANLENGDSLSQVQADMMRAREAFIKGAQQMGMTEAQAEQLANDLGLTAGATSTLASEIRNLPSGKSITVTVTTRYVTIGDPANSGYSARTLRSIAADGAIFSPRADGGFGQDILGRVIPREPMLGGPRHGKRYIMWGEDETHEEAYVSRKPGKEARNKGILEQAASWFGGRVTWAADGMWSRPAPIYSPPVQGRVSDAPVRIEGRLRLDGDGFGTLIDARIQADHDHARYDSRMVGVR